MARKLRIPPRPLQGFEPQWTRKVGGYGLPRLEDIKFFCERGVPVAFHDAWLLVQSEELEQPAWLVDETIKFFMAESHDRKFLSNYRRGMVKFYRWREVKYLLNKGFRLDDVFDEAARRLKGLLPYGRSSEAIRSSYWDVEADMKVPQKAARYYTAMRGTRVQLGISLIGEDPENPSNTKEC